MKHTSRLFYCIRCHTQVFICSHCDHGNIYCSNSCSREARIQSCRLAEKRYQLTTRGKMKHALRQRRYRARLQKKVTDHSSNSPTHNGLLQAVKNEAKEADMSHGNFEPRCCFCEKPLSFFFRSGFLRHHALSSTRDLSYFRPP